MFHLLNMTRLFLQFYPQIWSCSLLHLSNHGIFLETHRVPLNSILRHFKILPNVPGFKRFIFIKVKIIYLHYSLCTFLSFQGFYVNTLTNFRLLLNINTFLLLGSHFKVWENLTFRRGKVANLLEPVEI